MGAKVVVVEKRDSFSRNNVLHLWPFTIHDLRGLGAKKFYGKFCAGAIDHISEYLTSHKGNLVSCDQILLDLQNSVLFKCVVFYT